MMGLAKEDEKEEDPWGTKDPAKADKMEWKAAHLNSSQRPLQLHWRSYSEAKADWVEWAAKFHNYQRLPPPHPNPWFPNPRNPPQRAMLALGIPR